MFRFISLLKSNMALKLLLIIILVFLTGDILPYPIKSGLFALSLLIKQLLLFVLPVVIFSYLFSCVLSFGDKAWGFMLTLFVAVFISNIIGLYYGYSVAHFGLNFLQISFKKFECPVDQLMPLWNLDINPLIPNESALIAGALLGLVFTLFKSKKIQHYADNLNKVVSIFLHKIFIPILPLFALGFLLQMQHNGVLSTVFQTYAPILLLVIVALTLYLILMYVLGGGYKAFSYIKNAFPAGITGFSTMSSMAALPINVTSAEASTKDPETVRAVIPASTNIHMVGDSIIVPVLAMAVLTTFGRPMPDLALYTIFVGYCLFAKLAIAGVPGGGIITVLPLLEQYFGFNSEMSGLIYTLYVLFDPIDTTANVLGNNSFAIIMSKLFNWGKSKTLQKN